MKRFKMFAAFTLAETLITLGIIGVVAVIVLPSLINNSKDAELHTALKKVYADISAATSNVMQDNGGTLLGFQNLDIIYAYEKYLKYIKVCESRSTDCGYDQAVYQLSGHGPDSINFRGEFILSNGMLLQINYWWPDCGHNSAYRGGDCGTISVDINGAKKPNIIGKDIFNITMRRNKIEPEGTEGDWASDPANNVEQCIPGDTGWHNTGYTCTAKYLYQ